MNRTLLLADTHLQPYRQNNDSLSRWEKTAQQYALDKIINIIIEQSITKIVHLGDLLENSFPKDYELELVDYFFSRIPKGVDFTVISGNHELDRDSTKRIYYWEFMREYYKEKYGINIIDYKEIGEDLYCGHSHIHKLETLTKKYRYVFSHIRSSDASNKHFTDEINMVSLKENAKKVFLGDIHLNLEHNNIVYTGQSTWVNFPSESSTEYFDKVVPSVIILDEDSGEYERIALFEQDSPYQKKFKKIYFEEYDSLKDIAKEIEKDCSENNHFYKVRLFAKKFMIDKLKEEFKHLKHCVVLDIVNITLKDTEVQNLQINTIIKDNLDKGSVSANCLEYCKKALNEPRLEDLLCSTYATLEGSIEQDKLKEED